MRKTVERAIAVAVLTLLIAAVSFAQGQGQGFGQFQQFREEHKYTFQLMQMVHHIQMINQDPKHTLTPAQAKSVLAVIKPLSTKPKMTQDQAKQALKSLKRIFNVSQLNAMAKIKVPQRRMSSGGFSGPGGAGGQRPQGNRPRMDLSAMKNFNPFYAKASKNDQMTAARQKRQAQFISDLAKKANQAKPAPVKSKAKSSKAKKK